MTPNAIGHRGTALAALCLLATPALADVAGIATVIDGDTLEIHGQRIRQHGITALESAQRLVLLGNLQPLAAPVAYPPKFGAAPADLTPETLILEKAFGPAHPNVAASLENYAALLRETGRTSEADKMEARAKAIRVKRDKENK